MTIALVTGAAGLVGAAAVKHFAERGMDVVGIDNDMRKSFFGEAASTAWNRDLLLRTVPRYRHEDIDIRRATLARLGSERPVYGLYD